jgi:photosystem I reaction center subunit VIII
MIAQYLPSILIPIIGLFLPGIVIIALFLSIERDSIE